MNQMGSDIVQNQSASPPLLLKHMKVSNKRRLTKRQSKSIDQLSDSSNDKPKAKDHISNEKVTEKKTIYIDFNNTTTKPFIPKRNMSNSTTIKSPMPQSKNIKNFPVSKSNIPRETQQSLMKPMQLEIPSNN